MNLVQTKAPVVSEGAPVTTLELTIFGHSKLFYWWPVWSVGYLLALITYLGGETVSFIDGGQQFDVLIHPSKNLGVIFTVIVVLVVLMTNVSVRGVLSLTVIITALALTFFFAYMRWWDDIFAAVSFLAMYMNMGFYLFFATAAFIAWAVAFFVFDRFDYYTFRPGQVLHTQVMGGGTKSFSTLGLSVNKLRDDLFRHWILGLGSGDLIISTHGAAAQELVVKNVLFVGRKLQAIQRLVAMQPDESPANVVTAGAPE